MPLGCGGSTCGGGTAGPSGDFVRDRAGEFGEYHHSRNLMKKIAVGSSNRSESRSKRGDLNRKRRKVAIMPTRFTLSFDSLFSADRAAARYMVLSSIPGDVGVHENLQNLRARDVASQSLSTLAKVDST